MSEYHKIQTVYKRDMDGPGKPLILGDWSAPEFGYLEHTRWECTEKVDGTNIRVIVAPDGTCTYGGKTDNAQIPAKLLPYLDAHFKGREDALREKFPAGAILYGEGYGAGIQTGGIYRPDQAFILFDVRVDGWWLLGEDVTDVAAFCGIQRVPIVGCMTLAEAIAMVRIGAFHSLLTQTPAPAEGLVCRPAVPLFNRKGERVIAKIKFRDFKHTKETA